MVARLQREMFKFTLRFYLCRGMRIQLRGRGVPSGRTAHWSNSFTPPHLFRQEIHQLFLFFPLIPPPLRWYCPSPTLITLLSFPQLLWLAFTNERQANICSEEESLIIRASSPVESDSRIYRRCLSAPCHLSRYRFFSLSKTEVWLYLGERAQWAE